jgi:hypothetical protein
MSVIVVILEKNKIEASALIKLQKVLGGTLQSIKHSWIQEQPIIEMEVFEGDYQKKANIVRKTIRVIKEEDLNARYYELPYERKYENNAQMDTCKVTAEFVKDMLTAADDELDRQMEI